ncbi:MAG: hypothetical protein PW786_10485 [Arachidicoccus sp.]|nr:hypothetical protein [Arachidicoccus sp.]
MPKTDTKIYINDDFKTIAVGNFQNRSDSAQEIISRKPDFVEKWALFIFLGVLLALLAGTWFIRYPDIVQTRATLSAYNGPKEIMPLQTGRLIRLFVQNGHPVKQDDMIGWIESTANPEEALKLSKQLDSSTHLLALGKVDKIAALFNEHFQNLGSLQSSYQTYSTALQQFNDYLVNGFYARQKNMILNDMSAINQMNSSLKQQKQLTEQDNELSQQTYAMNKKLV